MGSTRKPPPKRIWTEEEELLVAKGLQTPEGRKLFKAAFQLACAKAADAFPEGSKKEALARRLAGLPPRRSV